MSAARADLPNGVTSVPFGKTPQGEVVTLYTMTNKNGLSVSVMDYGATIVKIMAPDRTGKLADVVLGFDKFAPYLKQSPYFGATVGRYANRIAGGQFSIGQTVYHVPKNDGPNSLHGGKVGFDKRMWKLEPVDSETPSLRFSRLSPDGEEGYPGNLFVSVTFSLNDENELRIGYEATTDQETVLNLTNHTYFNLAGSGTVLDQVVTIHADSYTPVDATQIPTGEIKAVDGTPFDLRSPTAIGLHIKETGGNPVGYDHNFVLQKGFLFFGSNVAAEVDDPASGRTLQVSTDQPGLQFYTGNHLAGLVGSGGNVYRQYSAFTMETQHFPDSPNHANFPSTLLKPGDTFQSWTIFAFGTK